jgi:hypothetical protein
MFVQSFLKISQLVVKRILKKPIAVSNEHSNDILGTIKGREFEQLSNY